MQTEISSDGDHSPTDLQVLVDYRPALLV